MAGTDDVERFHIATQLADAGLDMKRQSLRRLHPDATKQQIDQLLQEWLLRRPPDSPGRLRRSA